MKRSFAHVVAVLSALLAASGARGADSIGEEPAMRLFLQVCAIPYTHTELVEKEIRALGFSELDGEVANTYLDGAQGRVWAGTFQSKRFAVTLRPEVLCTVVAHDGKPAEIKAAVESWLPPQSSGVSVQTAVGSASAPLETTVYELRGGKVQERWVVTISSDPNSDTRAMLSWSRL